MGSVVSIASGVRECVSEETAYAMLSRAMQQTKIQPKSQKCLWRGKPRWQLSSEGVCRAHWAQVLPVVLISRHLQYTGATQADWNAGGVSGSSCDVICDLVFQFFLFSLHLLQMHDNSETQFDWNLKGWWDANIW